MIPVGQLRAVPLLQGLEDERYAWLSLQADEVVLAPGDTLLRQGAEGCGFFIIVAGELLLIHEQSAQETIAGRRAAPSFLGEISTLTGYPISVTCRASALPVRSRNGTPCHRQLSIHTLTAA